MKYFKVTYSNGFAECDEEYYFSAINQAAAEEFADECMPLEYTHYEPDEDNEDDYDDDWDDDYYETLTYCVEEVTEKEYKNHEDDRFCGF